MTSDNAPLAILQVLRAPVGGLFRHVTDLVRGLAARGHHVGVVADSTTGDVLADAAFAEIADHAALGVTRVPMNRQVGLRDFSAVAHVRSQITEKSINIAHGHGAKGGAYARLAATLAGSGRRPATLYTPHGGSLHYAPNSAAGLLFHNLERLLMPATDAFIFESAYSRDVFLERIGRPAGIVRVVHNGLKDEEFAPVAATDGGFDFVFVGELRQLKGVDVLIAALAELKAAEGRPATLNIVGGGPDEATFKQQVAGLGLGDRVVFSGVQRARIAFSTGRAAVVPSRAESLPYIVLEASAAGLPVISTQVGGIAEIFGPTADRLIPADDVGALRAAMADVMARPDTAAAEAAERRDFVARTFAVDMMVDSISALYRSLLAG
ncbi:MAG: glycosyltransferase [Hyphomicrobiales bacterium]|nr:glycosyltransferase [Hyphomicrobiales bacterium]